MVKFKSKYGSNLQEEELPAQAYFEEFQEKLAAGMLQAELLDQVISQAEAEAEDRKKPDPPRQYGMHLNAALTIQTRPRYTSILSKDLEEFRARYDVLSNCWLLGQQRQPGRALYSDVDKTTFPQILKELLGKKNFFSHERARRQGARGSAVVSLSLVRARVAPRGIQEVP